MKHFVSLHDGIFYKCCLCHKRFKMKDLGLDRKTAKVVCYRCVATFVKSMAERTPMINEEEIEAWKMQRRSFIMI